MKPLYSPAEVQFRAMKNQPPDDDWYCDRYNHSEWWCFWGKKGTDVVNKCCLPEFKAPFLPGEKCYLGEALYKARLFENAMFPYIKTDNQGIRWMMHYLADGAIPGRKPIPAIQMPEYFARRFFVVVSCVPMRVSEVTEEDAIRAGFLFDEPNQIMACENLGNWWQSKHPGKEWAWRIEVKEEING